MKINYEKLKGYRATVKVDKPIEEYALAFLHIYNNVKVRKNYKMYNDYGDKISVVCDYNDRNGIVDYLEQFGEVVEQCEVVLLSPWVELSDDEFDAIYMEGGMEIECLTPDIG